MRELRGFRFESELHGQVRRDCHEWGWAVDVEKMAGVLVTEALS